MRFVLVLTVLLIPFTCVSELAAQKPKEGEQEPVAAPDLGYRFVLREPVTIDTEFLVDNEYELWSVNFAMQLTAQETFADGSARVKVKLLYWRQLRKTADNKIEFDSLGEAQPKEDEDLALLRPVSGNDLCTADIAPDGSVSRVILAEEPYATWKKQGSQAIETARDALGRALPVVFGRPVSGNEAWEQEKNPCGIVMPFYFKYRFKVKGMDPKSGMVLFGLDGQPEFGKCALLATKQVMTESGASGTFDTKNHRLVSFELHGGFKSTFGEAEHATDYSYTYSVKTRVR